MFPEEVGFAYNLANIEDVETYATETVRGKKFWLERVGLTRKRMPS